MNGAIPAGRSVLALVTDYRPRAALAEAVAVAQAENRNLIVFGCVFPVGAGGGGFSPEIVCLPPDPQQRVLDLQSVIRATVPHEVCLRMTAALGDHRRSLRQLISSLHPEDIVVADKSALRLRYWARRYCAGVCTVRVVGRAG